VEWVETTGSTVEAAKDAALDQLGVDEQDAEFEILEEPKSGLFGLTRREARVRARVRPTSPRPKVERRDRRRPKSDGAKRGEARSGSKAPRSGGSKSAPAAETPADAGTADDAGGSADGSSSESARRSRRSRGSKKSESPAAAKAAVTPADPLAPNDTNQEGSPMSTDDATVEQQADIIADFVEGLVDAYGLDGEVSQAKIDDETIEVQIEGDDLGLLIGPKGQTLTAIQELSRTVVQRRASGTHHGRVRLDVSGYRQRRREALERFARSVADDVRESGVQKALEPMNAADRKVVHDTVNEIDGVSTVSEGEDQRRRVVILPVD
jgi:spoIIIJ-associated protein